MDNAKGCEKVSVRAEAIGLFPAGGEHSEALSELAFASKSYWNYSEEYLKAARPLLRITPEFITSNEVWIASESGRPQNLLGFFALCQEPTGILLDHFWIAPSYIGQGVGRQMFEKMRHVAEQHGWKRVLLYSDPQAEKFYSKMGATRIGEKPSRVACGPMFPIMEVLL